MIITGVEELLAGGLTVIDAAEGFDKVVAGVVDERETVLCAGELMGAGECVGDWASCESSESSS